MPEGCAGTGAGVGGPSLQEHAAQPGYLGLGVASGIPTSLCPMLAMALGTVLGRGGGRKEPQPSPALGA